MWFKEVKPFVRFIQKTRFLLREGFTIAYDYRLFLVTEGKGIFQTEKRTHPLKPGSLVYYPPGRQYHIFATESMEFYTVNFDFTRNFDSQRAVRCPEPMAIAQVDKVIEEVSFADIPAFNDFCFLDNMSFLVPELEEICREFYGKELFYTDICGELLAVVLARIARMLTVPTCVSKPHRAVNQALDLVHRYYADPALCNQMVASQMHYHENYLSSLVKKQTGLSLHQYIISYRLSKAILLLVKTDLSISKISESIGFCNAEHFSTVFAREVGLSPHQYRRQAASHAANETVSE